MYNTRRYAIAVHYVDGRRRPERVALHSTIIIIKYLSHVRQNVLGPPVADWSDIKMRSDGKGEPCTTECTDWPCRGTVLDRVVTDRPAPLCHPLSSDNYYHRLFSCISRASDTSPKYQRVITLCYNIILVGRNSKDPESF